MQKGEHRSRPDSGPGGGWGRAEVKLVARLSLDPERRLANVDELGAVQLCSISLMYLCHAPQLSSHSTARRDMRLMCANQGKFFVVFIGPGVPPTLCA